MSRIYTRTIKTPSQMLGFFADLVGAGEQRVAVSQCTWAQTFWTLYRAAKNLPEPTCDVIKAHYGPTPDDYNRNEATNPALSFKILFGGGRVWKDARGDWWFYFN